MIYLVVVITRTIAQPYSYHCPTCQATFDRFVPAEKRDEPQACPDGHPGGRRLFHSPALTQPDPRRTFRQHVSKTPNKFFT